MSDARRSIASRPTAYALSTRSNPDDAIADPMPLGTARHCRRLGPGVTRSVTEKKNGEDRQALAVRINRWIPSYCWLPAG